MAKKAKDDGATATKDDLFKSKVDLQKLVEAIIETKDKKNEAETRLKALEEELLEVMETNDKEFIEVTANGEFCKIRIDRKKRIVIKRDEITSE